MSFLTPLYLIGALGLAIPIILHLLNDRPKNKQAFGSLMFLDKTKPPVDRKRRPTHLLLLLLRCLALLLLAFVFARPFVTVDAPAAAGKRDRQWLTVLLDRSASMQRGDLWQQAKAKGIKCVINTDAHRNEHAGFLRLGTGIARKGWLTAKDVINTLPLAKLRKELSKKRSKK